MKTRLGIYKTGVKTGVVKIKQFVVMIALGSRYCNFNVGLTVTSSMSRPLASCLCLPRDSRMLGR
jgi:hypothetical protein